MAASVHDTDYQELNVVFKSLGERGKEAEVKKEYNDHVVAFILQQLSEYLSKTTANRIMARPYGSAAEDLKSLVPDDYGDVDIMVFPTSDDCLVHEELLEYSPDENPLHAKIKGRDHPVFQSCLVEDTGYLATSALKNFHSAIYGSVAPRLLGLLTLCIPALSREGECLYEWEKKKEPERSPALTIELQQSFETAVEQMRKMEECQIWQGVDVAQWEWFAKALCDVKGTEDTREHTEVLSDLLSELERVSATKDSSSNIFGNFPALFQEIVCGDVINDLKVQVEGIESRSQNETESGTSGVVLNSQNRVTPETRDADESGSSLVLRNDNEERYVTPQICDDGQGPTADIKPTAAFDSMENSRADPACDGVDDKTEDSTNTDQSGKEMRNSIENERLASEDVTHSEDYKEEAKKNERWRTKRWLVHLLGTGTEMKEGTEPVSDGVGDETEDSTNRDKSGIEMRNSIENENLASEDVTHSEDYKEEAEMKQRRRTSRRLEDMLGTGTEEKEETAKSKEYKRKEGVDLVPALRSQGWPKVAKEWIKRDRKWPPPEVVDKVIQEGHHMVVKPPKNDDCKCFFRISFSHAEFLLSQEMNEVQRECYRCLKKFHRDRLSEPPGLKTFYLKTILLQTIEETGAEMWTEGNRAECMMKLLGNLLKALTKKDLPHFFVSSYNLFGVNDIEDPKILESLAEKVEEIMESPLGISKTLIQKYQKEANTVEKHKCEETEKTRSEGHDENQSKEETSTTEGISATPSYGYHELEAICLEVSKELTDKALTDADCDLETLDPVERSLVEDLRELASIHGLKAEEFLRVIKTCWESTMCYKVWMSTEPDMRRRMLDAIQGHVEMIKWALKQDDFAAGNEQAIADRILDRTVDDPFDLNHVIPAGGVVQLLGRTIESLLQSPSQPTQHMVNMDDILLD